MSRNAGAHRGAGEAGFTLLEVVVALVVLGILLATLSQGTRFGFAAFDRQTRMIDSDDQLAAADRTLRRLVERADPGDQTEDPAMTGTPHGLAFRAPLPAIASDQLADLRLAVSPGNRLTLSWLPHRHVLSLRPPPRPQVELLLDGVTQVDLSYFSGGAWHTRWSETGLPDLVRIRIVFDDAEGKKPRHWPDIVVSPRRERPSQ